MLSKILRFLRGYLLIEIRGNALERFINQIIDKDIDIWQLERIKKDHYRARINIQDFNRLRPLVKKRMCWVKIKYKGGLPFVFLKARRRSFLLLGFIFFLIIFWAGSSFLWFIDINGLDKISEDTIYHILNDAGVKVGTLKNRINLTSLEKKLLQQEPRITWVNLLWEGTRLKVEIVEKKIVKKTEAGNIIASQDGVITELIVLKGLAAVEEGDTVAKGQILIIGPVDASGQKETARGVVKGHVWYEEYGEADLQIKDVIYTGESKTFLGVKIGSKVLILPLSEPPFESYVVETRAKKWSEWRNINFPIELIRKEYKEVKYLVEDRKRDVALFIAKERAMEKILNERLSPEAVIISIEAEEVEIKDEKKVRVRVLLKAEENLAELVANDKEDLGGRN